MPTNQENSSNVKDYLDINNLQGEINGVNSTFGDVYEYIGKGSDIGVIFNADPVIGKTLGYFSNKAAIIDAIDSGVNGGYNGFMSSIAGTFSGASATMLVASLAPQAKGFSFVVKLASVAIGWEVGDFTKETFLNKEYRQLEFDPYDTQTHKFENGNWYEKNDNGTLTLIEDTEIINNLTQGAEESQNFNFYKNSTGEVVIEPKNPAFGEYYNIKTNGDIQTISDNGLTVTTKQTGGIIRVETFSSTEDTKNLTSLTVINPDGTYEYKNEVTGDYSRNTTDEYLQNVKTSEGISQIKIDKNTGKAIVKTFDGDEWEVKEYESASEINEYIKDGGEFEYVDENSSVIKTSSGGKIVFHNNGENEENEEKYVLDKDGNLKSYEIKNKNGEYQKYKGDILNKLSDEEVESLSNTLTDDVYDKKTLENSLNDINKSDLTQPSEIGYISLEPGQTISHIAANTKYTSIELLEYNNLTLEEAKSLPVGFKVKIPADKPEILASENGNIKLYKNPDGTTSAILQGENNTTYKVDNVTVSEDRKNLSYKKDGIEYEVEKDSNTGLMYTKEINSEDYNISFKMEDGKKVLEDIEIKNDDVSIKDIAKYVDYTEEEIKEFNHIQTDIISTNDNIQLPVDKKMIEGGYGKITQYETQDGNYVFIVPNKDETTTTYATFTDGFNEKGSYEISPSGSITVSFEDRMVIANNENFSNIEKIAVGTTVATIADFATYKNKRVSIL